MSTWKNFNVEQPPLYCKIEVKFKDGVVYEIYWNQHEQFKMTNNHTIGNAKWRFVE